LDGQQELPTVAIHAARNSRCGAGGTTDETFGGDGCVTGGAGKTIGAGGGGLTSCMTGGGGLPAHPAIKTMARPVSQDETRFISCQMRRSRTLFGNGFLVFWGSVLISRSWFSAVFHSTVFHP
jgi:hypothetical protein